MVDLDTYLRNVLRAERYGCDHILLLDPSLTEDGSIVIQIRPQDGDHIDGWRGEIRGHLTTPLEMTT